MCQTANYCNIAVKSGEVSQTLPELLAIESLISIAGIEKTRIREPPLQSEHSVLSL